MNQDAIKEIAKQLGVGANYLAEHLTDLAPQWGMFKAIQNFAVDAITHLAVPQVAMINDMLEMVQQ